MKPDEYPNEIERSRGLRERYKKDYKRRLQFARDNGCNTAILTGTGEPLMNPHFLEDFFEWNDAIHSPFRWIELQTSGVTLGSTIDNPDGIDHSTLEWLRDSGVSTISVSMSAWDDPTNAAYNGTPKKLAVAVDNLCKEIRAHDFNLRLSINMTCAFEQSTPQVTPEDLFRGAHKLGAAQITFRELYESGDPELPQNRWIRSHRLSGEAWERLRSYVTQNGRRLERLPFGAYRYSVGGVSTVMDEDCMSTAEEKDTLRYLILRPDCHLYSKWDDKGSLVF